jgi:thiol-disulfide isomerase/thioredoxin
VGIAQQGGKEPAIVIRAVLFVLLGYVFATTAMAQDGQQRADMAGRSLVGTSAPRAVLRTIDGKTIDLGKFYGKKAVYLKFWATWCVPCREQMPHLKRVYESAGPDLEVIAIDVGYDDTVERVRALRKQIGLRMPIVFDDGSLGTAFHVLVTPQHIVIGRDGRIMYVGHTANAQLDAALLAARTETPANTPMATAGTFADVAAIHIGDRLPDFAAPTLPGSLPVVDATAKRPTVLFFLSPWCESYLGQKRAGSSPERSATCRAVREQIDALSRKEPHVRWLGIVSRLWASKQDLLDYRKQYKLGISLMLDETGTIFRQFRVTQEPTLIVADADGRVVERIDGFDKQLGVRLKELGATHAQETREAKTAP